MPPKKHHLQATTTTRIRKPDRADLIIMGLIALTWIAAVYAKTGGARLVMFDTMRDMAYARNVAAGILWTDPTIPGQPYWYAPGNPFLMAAIAKLTGADVLTIYASSAYWWNGLLPILLYLFVRQSFGRTAAIFTLPAVFLGSLWWLTHAPGPMPSIQGVVLNILTLITWRKALRAGWHWTALTGLLLAAAVWFHPLCAIVLAAAIALHAILLIWLRPSDSPPQSEPNANTAANSPNPRFAPFRRMLIVAGITGILAAPLIIHLATLQKQNTRPFKYFATELLNKDFFAHLHAPLIIPLGLVGLVWMLRRRPRDAVPACYLVIGGLGQIGVYIPHIGPIPIPYFLAHEFQWHLQLATGICAAVALAWIAHLLTRKLPLGSAKFARFIWPSTLMLLVFTPAIPRLPHFGAYLRNPDAQFASNKKLITWIRQNTEITDVIACDPYFGYHLVAGLTGRKCVAVRAGHMNPQVDAQKRWTDLETILTTTNQQDFAALADKYSVDYLLVIRDDTQPNTFPQVQARYKSWPILTPRFSNPHTRSALYAYNPAP